MPDSCTLAVAVARMLVCTCLAGIPLTTAAQTASEPAREPEALEQPNRAIEEVIVTAQRREESLEDVPASVSVVDGADLARENLLEIGDLTERIPTVKATPGITTALINIRGFGSGENIGFDQAVSLFVDGAARPRGFS